MKRNFYQRGVLAVVVVLLGCAGCKPYFMLATQEDKIMLDQVLEQEQEQLEQLDRLPTDLNPCRTIGCQPGRYYFRSSATG